ncbi:MAG: hypothetical protein JXR20_09045 [Balneola sp.]
MNTEEIDRVASAHVRTIPLSLSLAGLRVKSMDIEINGKMMMFLVIQEKARLVIWSLQGAT